ncbi:MAG: IS630 family transposase [Candidatus Syntrophosphaera sp.]|nr:IS630 family transposase [Candidatus Syntrophosphaera sp.]
MLLTNEFDGRKINRKALEEIRIRAVKRVEAGESPEVVIKALGLTRPRIYEWIAKYREGGVEALRSSKATGRPSKLAGKDLQKIYRLVVGRDPRQLKFPFALWTRGMVRELISREFSVRLSDVSVGRLLHKLGLSPQRPVHRAYQQDQTLVVDWMAKDFPAIKKLAKQEGAAIYFGDEASVRSDYHSGTTWAPKGKTPVVATTGARFKVNVLSAISPKGELRFMATENTVNSEVFCEFLGRLIANATAPVFLIVDNHSVHRSEKVREFVRNTKGKLRLFHLPPYSPELNPDELVWNYLKNHNMGRMSHGGKKEFHERVITIMQSLQQLTDKIKGFFRHPIIKYTEMFGDLCTD